MVIVKQTYAKQLLVCLKRYRLPGFMKHTYTHTTNTLKHTHTNTHTQTRTHTHTNTQGNTQRDKHLHTQRQKSEKGSIHHKKLRIDDRSVATNMWLTEDTAYLCSRISIRTNHRFTPDPADRRREFSRETPPHCSKLA